MHFTWCQWAVNCKFELATLRIVLGAGYEVDTTPYQIVKRREEECHSLYLARCYEMVQLEFEIYILEANAETTKGMVAYI